MAGVRAFAPAKINLALHVGPPRADGRHELASIVAFCDAGDWVELEEGPAGLTVTGPFAASLANETDNLVTRALALVAEGRSVRVKLEKNLPVASGIGGGSSDAAAALRAARTLLGLSLSDAELASLAAKLGSDLPACVWARTAIMRGAGEDTEALALSDLFAVLVNPGVSLSTAAVYRRFDERAIWGDLDLKPIGKNPIASLVSMRNDLESAGADLAPAVSFVISTLRQFEGVRLARMSGSGATCFALVGDRVTAHGLAERLRIAHPHWWVYPTRLGAIDVVPRRV
ncbi:MAG: 4-(cytidine 5'-diphospho)-2-C-methyl-D-erythritol kinase [Alphaproteobacteria bacterium]